MRALTIFAPILLLGATQAQTDFKRCSLLGKNRNELCFKTIIDEITVQIGKPGTNDDVTIECCSDKDKTDCCKTPALKSTFSDDWSEKDTEVWGDRYFGPCKKKVFEVKNSLICTLAKDGSGLLNVTSLVIDTKSPEKKIKEPERFICPGGFKIGGPKNPEGKQTKTCKTGPYKFFRIFKAEVTMGDAKKDGTDDDVKVTIGSDANAVKCQKKLSGALSDDWKYGKTEKWEASYFGDCAKILYKIQSQPRISVTKKGNDDLKVKGMTIDFDIIDTVPKRVRYTCPGFAIQGVCKDEAQCIQNLNNCKKKDVSNEIGLSGADRKKLNSRTTTRKPPSRKPPSRTPSSGSIQDKINFFEGQSKTTTLRPTTTTKKRGIIDKLLGKNKPTTVKPATTTTVPTTTTEKKGLLNKIFG